MANLTAFAVNIAFVDVLFRNDEIVDGKPIAEPVKVEGITANFALHPVRLESKRTEVANWLDDLPATFLAKHGGGWTFLNLCHTKDGVLWTGMHQTMEELCVLAIGLGLGKWLMPRENWDAMPGGLPYVVFDADSFLQGVPS